MLKKKRKVLIIPMGFMQNIIIKKLRGIHFGAQIIAAPTREERIHIAYLAASPYAGQRITVHYRSLVAILHFCFTWHTFIQQIQEKKCFNGAVGMKLTQDTNNLKLHRYPRKQLVS